MGQSIRTCFSKYAIFHGRAVRSEYWWFFLIYICLNHGATLFDEFIYKIPGEPIHVGGEALSISSLIVVLLILYIPKFFQEYILHFAEVKPWQWIRSNVLS